MPQGPLQSALTSQLVEHKQEAENGTGQGLADHLYGACQRLANQSDDLRRQLTEVGQAVSIKVRRGAAAVELKITPASRE